MSKKIYIIRHGQTDFNKRGVVQGSGIDASLNEEGQAQSQLFFEAYKNIPFQKVYASGLKRSQETIAPFINLGIPHEFLPDLNEIHWGSKEGLPFTEEENRYYYNMLDRWKMGQTDYAIDGGESPELVAARLAKALHRIMEGPEDLILVCMHGRAMRILLCIMLNYPIKCMDYFLHNNLSLYVLNNTGSMFQVEKYNDRSHLLNEQ